MPAERRGGIELHEDKSPDSEPSAVPLVEQALERSSGRLWCEWNQLGSHCQQDWASLSMQGIVVR